MVDVNLDDVVTEKANVSDVETITNIAREIFPQDYPNREKSSNFFEEMLSISHSIIYVAKLGEEILGYAYYFPIVRGGTIELIQIGVKKDYRGKGIGTKLISEADRMVVDYFKSLDVPVFAIYITTSFDNPVGQKLYEKTGYKVKGHIDDAFLGIGSKEIVMVKVIDKSRKYEEGKFWDKEKK